MLQKHLSNHDDCHHCQKIQMRLSKWCCWLVGRGSENLFYTWDFPISGILQQQLLLHKDESQKKKKNWKEAILDNNRQCVISRTFYWVLPGSSIDTKISPHRIEIHSSFPVRYKILEVLLASNTILHSRQNCDICKVSICSSKVLRCVVHCIRDFWMKMRLLLCLVLHVRCQK